MKLCILDFHASCLWRGLSSKLRNRKIKSCPEQDLTDSHFLLVLKVQRCFRGSIHCWICITLPPLRITIGQHLCVTSPESLEENFQRFPLRLQLNVSLLEPECLSRPNKGETRREKSPVIVTTSRFSQSYKPPPLPACYL